MTFNGIDIGWVLASYLLGCITMGYYLVRWRTGQDIRGEGSGNVGARNVGRLLGAPGFATTLLFDLSKGALAVAGARFLGLAPEMMTASLLAVILGHNWPMQLRFRGGKGVAVSLGALLVYDYFTLVVLFTLFLPLWGFTRNFTLSGMLAYSLAPLFVFLSGLGPLETFTMSAVAMAVVVAHRKNIRESLAPLIPDREGKQDGRRPSERHTS